MAIRFRCHCGKLLEADDGTAGKRTRCPACQLIQTIPAQEPTGIGLQLTQTEPAAAPREGSRCPNCGQPLAPGAVLCVQCGYNVQTGAAPGAAAEASAGAPAGAPSDELDEEEAGETRFALPVKKIAAGAALLAVLALAWFFVIKPFTSGMNMSTAETLFANGDLDKAAAKYKEIRDKVSAANGALCDLRVKQIALEKKLNTGRVFSNGKNLNEPRDLEITNKAGVHSSGAASFKIRVRNNTQDTITLKRDYFYIRGSSDLVVAHEHTDNKLGQVVKPGESAQALAHFRRLPQFKANRKLGRRTEKVYFLTFNDGTHYVKWLLDF